MGLALHENYFILSHGAHDLAMICTHDLISCVDYRALTNLLSEFVCSPKDISAK